MTLRAAASTDPQATPVWPRPELRPARDGRLRRRASSCRLLAEGEAAADVGLVAFDGAAVVDEDQAAFLEHLRLDRAVRERGIAVDLATGVAGKADPLVGRADPLADLAVGDAGLDRLPRRFVDRERDVVGQLHQLQLGGAFDGAAAGGDRRGADGFKAGIGFADAVGEDEGDALFHAELAAVMPRSLRPLATSA
jgi:hypothetical protein